MVLSGSIAVQQSSGLRPHQPPGSAGSKKKASSLLEFDSDMHYYPKRLFLEKLQRGKKQREFRIISKYFVSENSAVATRLYEQFLFEYLAKNKSENLGLRFGWRSERIKQVVSRYLSGEADRQRTIHDVYDDLYRGDLFEWLLTSPSLGL